ncbi:MAG: cytochrome c biogenesis protein CcsA [Bacteroidota bacterium]|jgi:heme exporter protein C
MKAIIIISGLIIGLAFGLFPTFGKAKPTIWRILAVIFITFSVILGLLPPVGGTFYDLVYLSKFNEKSQLDIRMQVLNEKPVFDEVNKQWNAKIKYPDETEPQIYNLKISGSTFPNELNPNNVLIVKMEYLKNQKSFKFIKIVSVNPIITLPYVLNLGERAKILNFHVPVAWLSVLAYLISMIFAIKYLKTRDLNNDIIASSSAVLGTIFCLLATVTGMVWAKFNWGSYWNWDPRETSIFVLLLIYGAYFALRSAIDKDDLRARLSSIYSIIAFITVPFFIFVLPRITSGLHPGSAGEGTAGPILSSQSEMLNLTKTTIFSLCLSAFTVIYFWMLNISVRIKKLQYKSGMSL